MPDKHPPALLYFDADMLPLYQADPTVGLRLTAHSGAATAVRDAGEGAAATPATPHFR